jgi:SAM-dependent methyltransferase
MLVAVDPRSRQNQVAWDVAATKYVVETDALLAEARTETALLPEERELLGPVLAAAPRVVHLQSGHGLEDLDLVRAGARSVVGVDFSRVTAGAAHGRARQLGPAPPVGHVGHPGHVGYVVGDALRVGLRDGCADLVYTGKGALMWLPDIGTWAREVARLLRPGGHLFVHEAHPAACLWTRDTDPVRVDARHGYFGGTRVNDTFPASAIDRYGAGRGLDAVEWQWTLADVVGATLAAGLELRHLAEHPEPFWRPEGVTSAAWAGHLPNSFSLLARAGSHSGDG